MPLRPGDRIGNLRVVREMGEGPLGRVFLARDEQLDRTVTLKELPALPGDPAIEKARAVAALRDPHVVTLFGIRDGPDGGGLLEMEHLEGGDLEARLRSGLPLGTEEAARIAAGVALALAAAHAAGLVHGDVKPASVLFAADGTPKLSDLGLAALRDPGMVAATPASDVRELGVLLCRLLAGGTPLPAGVPAALAEVAAACLRDDPRHRPPAVAVARDLAAFLRSRAARPDEPGAAPPSGRDRETAELARMVVECRGRLVTLTGPPGIGKGALARSVAAGVGSGLPGGSIVAEFETGADPGAALRGRAAALLVLDASRAPVERAADAVSRWRRAAPEARFLVVSCCVLGIEGETVFPLHPLPGRESDPEITRAVRGFVAALPDWERTAFAGACSLPDGFTIDDAEAAIDLSGFPDAPFLIDALQGLAEKSLLTAPAGSGGGFSLLPAVREAGR